MFHPDNEYSLVQLRKAYECVEKDIVIRAIQHTPNRQKAADLLGLSERGLQYKIKKYGITERGTRPSGRLPLKLLA